MDPIVIVNFKCYPRGTADSAVAIAKACQQRGASVAVQATDIYRVSQAVPGVRVLAQHVDAVPPGAHTGAVTAEAVLAAGASGTLLNHSEHRVAPEVIRETIKRCQEVGLRVVLCAESIEEALSFSRLPVSFIAIELPELIGGDVSVTTADPSLVSRAVDTLGKNVLLGAGVSTHEDLQVALQGGAAGVLLASAIVQKTDEPAGALDRLYGVER